MTARRKTAGRDIGKRKLVGLALTVAAATLVLATELPQGLSRALGGSAALAELAARSPGARIGGVALKGKTRFSLAPVAGVAGPAAGAPGLGNPVASVQGASVGPEGPVPTSGPIGPGGFPNDFLAPGLAGVPIAAAPGAAPGAGPPIDFGGGPLPIIGGLPIFVPGGPGGTIPPGTPGGGGVIVPPPLPPVPPAGPIPEPSTWLLLIAGFGLTGGAMRRRRRVATA